jgi:hypothetical protein
MTAPTDPLDAGVVDELLSAELDGDFDAAARDHGLDPAVARARLAATPGVDARRDALARARDTLAVPTAPLGPETRAAILAAVTPTGTVGTAGAAGADELAHRRSRSWPRFGGIAAVAAAILIVVGLAVSLTSTGGGDDASTAGDAAGSGTADSTIASEESTNALTSPVAPGAADASGATRDFGAVDDPAQLRDAVQQALTGAATDDEAGGDAAERQVATEAAPPAGTDCVRTQTENLDVDPATAPVLVGAVVYQGTPADVLVYPRGAEQLIVVLTRGDCRLLVTQSVLP